MARKTSQARIGLALGGGGARGFAHVAALKAFDELGLKPAHIIGTSIGAIMGAGYASGASAKEIEEFSLATFSERGKALAKLVDLRPRSLRELWTAERQSLFQIDVERVLDVYVPDLIARDFAQTKIPFSAVAADFYGWSEVELDSGSLRQAVAASSALPTIFKPVVIDGRVLVDGGLVNPMPFDRLKDCDIIVAVDVVGGPSPRHGRNIPNQRDLIFGTTQILMQSITNAKLRTIRPDVLLKPRINDFKVLDFLKVKEVLAASAPITEELKQKLETILEKNAAKA